MVSASVRLVPLLLAMSAVFLWTRSVPVLGVEDAAPRLYVKDALVSPNQTADIEALLVRQGARGNLPVPGETLDLVQNGKVVATATTDTSGSAVLRHTPLRKGTTSLAVKSRDRSGSSASDVVTVAAWERRTPLLVVEMAALMDQQSQEALPDAAEELGKLTQFYYNVMYLAGESGKGERVFQASSRARQWLAVHHFPAGYILAIPSTSDDGGAKIDELRSAGWTTIKIGIGRTRQFAEIFLQRRLEVVLVPEPEKGSAPKKARVAKDWKDVRRKL